MNTRGYKQHSEEPTVLFGFLKFFLLISPAATIVHFLLLPKNFPVVIYLIILTPTLLVLTNIGAVGKGFNTVVRRQSHALILGVTICIISIAYLKAHDRLLEGTITLVRFGSSMMLFFIGLTFNRWFLVTKNIKSIAFFGIAGTSIGIITYYILRTNGYYMTHSITADGAIGPALYYLTNASRPLIVFLVLSIFVLLSGKGANLIAFTLSLVWGRLTPRMLIRVLLVAGVLFAILYWVDFMDYLPNKLAFRLNLFQAVISNDLDLDSGIGSRLTSGRYDEIMYVLNKWSAEPAILWLGEGLSSYVVSESGEIESTIHMSYLKFIDMLGLVGSLPLLLIFGYALTLSYKLVQDRHYSLYSFFVVTQILLAFFQYSIMQDPMFWLSFGVLYSSQVQYKRRP